MNIKKILTITILAIFVVGMIIGAADAAHTFTKGKYQMKVTDKQYNKLKKASPYSTPYICKKVGTQTVKKIKTKTIKTDVFRFYYSRNRQLVATKSIKYNQKYLYDNMDKWIGSKYKTVKHYRADGSLYYEERITYDRFRITTKTKRNIWMVACKDGRYFDNKIHVEIYEFKPFPSCTNI